MSEYKQVDELLGEWLKNAFKNAFPEADLPESIGRVVVSTNPVFGDYQCNDAMALSKVLRCPPREIATKVVNGVGESHMISKIEIAGPGFINITLNPEFISERVVAMSKDCHYGIPQCGAGQCVVVDYSSPNVAKPMHVGHIRSTVIGCAIDKLHRALGYKVVADNHIGDWGTQFGLIIKGYKEFLDKEALEKDPVEELLRIYKQSNKIAKEDEVWLDACRLETVKLQQGDPENRALWQEFIRLSRVTFDTIYERLGVKFDITRGESYYQPYLQNVVDRLKDVGLAEESDGAMVVKLEEEKLGVCIVQKSDGGFNYATTDIATVDSRVKDFAPTRIIYVTDERQQLHFKQFFTVCRKLGIVPATTELEHVWFGLMTMNGKPFSTRDGDLIKLADLLDEAEARALSMIKERRNDMSDEEAKELAKKIGVGSIKYTDLSQDPRTIVDFTWEKALSLDGNSAPYLQYAHARIRSVLAKFVEAYPEVDLDTKPILLQEDIEKQLVLKLLAYPSAVRSATLTYRPCVLADYLYDLSQMYSSFYQRVPFLKAEDGVRESRLRICTIVADVLSKGLAMLGIETPERI